MTGKIIIILLAIFVGTLAMLYYRQDKMVYPRRQYRADFQSLVPPRAVQFEFEISCGIQKAWYVPPQSANTEKALPERLWLLFGGNGSLALYWNDTVQKSRDADAGFILFDYPGYGFCEGDPSPQSISESADAVLTALADWMSVPEDQLRKKPLRLMGHSLGTGVALDYATRHDVDRLVLFAPFTSMRDMANRIVTPMFSWLLRYQVDSMDALEKIAKKPNPPEIVVIHGTADDIVPVEMGRQMAAAHPQLIQYVELPGADHVNLLDDADIYTAIDLAPIESTAPGIDSAGNGLPAHHQ